MANVETAQLHDFVNGETVDEAKLDQNFEVLRIAGNDTNTKVNAISANGAIGTSNIADGAVTTPKIADANVTNAKLADGSVTNAKLADNSITGAKIVDGTITNAEIASGTITQDKIVAGTLDNRYYTETETDVLLETKVNKSGDTLTGYLNLHANPTNTNHPATKDYTDSRDALKVSKSGDTMTGALVLNGNPTQNLEAAPKQYVDQKIADLTASAPGLLDTLDEIAAALGDDPNFATTITNQLATKAPLASPTFTGTVTVPEPATSSSAVTKNYVDTVDATKAPINSPSFTGTTNFNGNVDFNKNYAIDLAIVNSATAPTTPVEGQMWYDTTEQRLKVYRGAVKGWTNISSKGAQIKEKIITATSGQTSFSISDVGSYEVGTHNIFVFKNKQLLTKTVDYSEANTTTISLFVGATAGDVLDLIWFENDPEVLSINVQSTVNRTFQTSTAGQQTFTVVGGYQVGLLDVYLNGVRLQLTNDYTATDGTTVVLNSAVTAGQELEFVSFDYAGVAPAVTSFNGRGGDITLTTSDINTAGAVLKGTTNTDVNLIKAFPVQTDTRSTELTYDGSGNLTNVVVKDGATVVSTQTLTYTNGNLTQTVEVAGGKTITKTLNYTNGNLTSVTKAVV